MYRSIVLGLVLVVALVTGAMAQEVDKGSVTGMLVTDGVTGQEAIPHGWSEEPVYAISLKDGKGMGTRTAHNPPGWFTMPGGNSAFPGFATGKMAVFTLGYDDIEAFGMRTDLKKSADAALTDFTVITPAHYSVMYNKGPEEWGDSPWTGGTDFYQTFVATSPYITRVATKLADKAGDHDLLTLNYAIYEPNDGPPSKWKRISPIRSRIYDKGTDPIIHIYHVTYRSNEVSLTPGKTYAVRFWRDPSSPSPSFAIVAHRDNGDSYAKGQLYNGDKPMPEWDAYAYVSGGEPGTIVNHAPVGDMGLKDLAGTGKKLGQTFKASGMGVAGVDIIFTDGSTNPPSAPITFQIYDKPGGKAIGPARVCYGVPGAFQGRAAAVWLPGEAPVTPGQVYYLEWSSPNGFNTWVLNEDLPGEAYVDGKKLPDKDLAMSIVEYEGAAKAK